MEIYRRHTLRGKLKFLALTGNDLKTGAANAVIVDPQAKTVQRVPDLQKLLLQGRWEQITKSDPTLDQLVRMVPALRRYRGIEVRLPAGETAWICWREWSSESAAVQALLTSATSLLTVPKFELDGDYYLASQAMEALGGQVLDKPRSEYAPPESGY